MKTDFGVFVRRYVPKKDRPAILFVVIAGALSHFLYEWTGGNALVALFCPVNESVWEHLKLFYFPFLLCTLGQAICRNGQGRAFLYVRFLGVLCGFGVIVVPFYTYTGILGRELAVVDILLFVIAVIISFRVSDVKLYRHVRVPTEVIVYMLWLGLSLLFFAWTCFPPDLPIFYSPE